MDNNNISLDGFQIVSGDYFAYPTKTQEPTITIWDGSIGFSKQDIVLLNSCENVRIHINYQEKKILVSTTNSNDKDGIRWMKKSNPIEARKISCLKLTDNLYSTWNWDCDYIYRTRGRLVTSGNKVMLLFDFNVPEKWKRPEAKHVQ